MRPNSLYDPIMLGYGPYLVTFAIRFGKGPQTMMMGESSVIERTQIMPSTNL